MLLKPGDVNLGGLPNTIPRSCAVHSNSGNGMAQIRALCTYCMLQTNHQLRLRSELRNSQPDHDNGSNAESKKTLGSLQRQGTEPIASGRSHSISLMLPVILCSDCVCLKSLVASLQIVHTDHLFPFVFYSRNQILVDIMAR